MLSPYLMTSILEKMWNVYFMSEKKNSSSSSSSSLPNVWEWATFIYQWEKMSAFVFVYEKSTRWLLHCITSKHIAHHFFSHLIPQLTTRNSDNHKYIHMLKRSKKKIFPTLSEREFFFHTKFFFYSWVERDGESWEKLVWGSQRQIRRKKNYKFFTSQWKRPNSVVIRTLRQQHWNRLRGKGINL